jgi:hypothetical protein
MILIPRPLGMQGDAVEGLDHRVVQVAGQALPLFQHRLVLGRGAQPLFNLARPFLNLLLDRLVGLQAHYRQRQYIGNCLKEVDLLVAEHPTRGDIDAQAAKRIDLSGDNDQKTTDHSVVAQ